MLGSDIRGGDNAASGMPSTPASSAKRPRVGDGEGDGGLGDGGGAWACAACTLLNMADAKRCVLCDALKGSSLAAASTLAQQRQTGRSPRNAEASEAGKTEGQRGSLAAFLSQTARGRGK